MAYSTERQLTTNPTHLAVQKVEGISFLVTYKPFLVYLLGTGKGLGLSSQITTSWLPSNNRNVFPPSFEGQNSEIGMLTGPCFSESSRGDSFLASSYLLVGPGVPWCSLSCSYITSISCLCLYMALISICPPLFL